MESEKKYSLTNPYKSFKNEIHVNDSKSNKKVTSIWKITEEKRTVFISCLDSMENKSEYKIDIDSDFVIVYLCTAEKTEFLFSVRWDDGRFYAPDPSVEPLVALLYKYVKEKLPSAFSSCNYELAFISV